MSLAPMDYAPIALFVYKRPEHTRQTLKALMQCPEFQQSKLYVFCDGAKGAEDRELVDKTKAVVHALANNRIILIEALHNKGLANSIILGVTKLVNEFGKVIVLEDDLIVHPDFLQYMNHALENYQNENRVMQISGYLYPVPKFSNLSAPIFLPLTVSWGWATWKRAWHKFEECDIEWQNLDKTSDIVHRFNINGNYDYYHMLQQQISGQIDSWAIRWYWSVFKIEGLILFPPRTLILNKGLDGSGTHEKSYQQILKFMTSKYINKGFSKKLNYPLSYPDKIEVSYEHFLLFQQFLKKKKTLTGIKNKLKQFFDI